MFQVKNSRTGKIVKNPISCKPHQFETQEHAQKWADTMTRSTHLDATAFNSTRPSQYVVIAA